MALPAVDRPSVGRDPDDHRPVWAFAEGEPLVDGIQAWRRLGTGLRCETWLGWASDAWHPVVVKLPRPHEVDNSRAWANLSREVFVLRRAAHPALPRLYADQTAADLPYVIMEHIDGPTLADVIDDHGPLDAESLVRLGSTLLSALAVVHSTGAAHVDVKPDNVMVRDGHPMVIDFGSARPLGSRQPAGRPLGTIGYAAPEMEACQPISATMDVYGVGAVLREALAGHPTLHVLPAGKRRRTGRLGRLCAVVDQLVEPDPVQRPDVLTSLRLLNAVADGELAPSWSATAVPPQATLRR